MISQLRKHVAHVSLVLLSFLAARHAPAVELHYRDIVVADTARDQVIRIDPKTGQETVISSGGYFDNPADLVLDDSGTIFVPDYVSDGIVRIDPATGVQTHFALGLVRPTGIAWDGAGKLLVSVDSYNNHGAIARVDPVSGDFTIVAETGFAPRGLARAADGTIYIASFSRLLRIDPITDDLTTFLFGGLLDGAFDVAIDSQGKLLIANEFGQGVVRVDPATGAQSLLASGFPPFLNPMGIAIDVDGSLLVANQGSNSNDGGVLRVNAATGESSVISSLGHLHGIAVVVPEPGALAEGAILVALCGLRRRCRLGLSAL